MDIKKLLEQLRNSKSNLYNILIVMLIGIFILVVSSFFTGTEKVNSDKVSLQEKEEFNDDILNYETKIKNELKYVLSKIKGVGNVEVVVYFESGEEQVPAVDVNKSQSTTQEKDNSGGNRVNNQTTDGSKVVMTNKGSQNEPLILKTYRPKLTGILIVAQGAEDKQIQYEIGKVISNLYNIPLNKVNVCSMAN